MANALFTPGREGLLIGEIAWNSTPVFKGILVRGYTFNASHKFVSDVTGAGGTIVQYSAALTGLSGTSGTAGAATFTFSAVPSGVAIPAMLVVMSSALAGGSDVAASAQRLVEYVDTAAIGSPMVFPVTPNGGDIAITPASTGDKLFTL